LERTSSVRNIYTKSNNFIFLRVISGFWINGKINDVGMDASLFEEGGDTQDS
jgi:hypothetical protein